MIIVRKGGDRMCNLSEGVWEKGKTDQLIHDIEKLISKGMTFDEVVNLLDITPDNAAKIKEKLNKKGAMK